MISVEVAPRDLGTLIHEILAMYVSECLAGDVEEDWLITRLESLPPEQAAEVHSTLWPFLLRITPDIRCADCVMSEMKLAATYACGEWFDCEYDDPDARLRGILDRIDWLDDVVLVTDYKTGWGGHDTLQGLIYALLVFVNNPDVRLVRVQFANPLHNYLSEAYSIERDDCMAKAQHLMTTIEALRERGYDKPLSYSALRKHYQCPASFHHYRTGELPDPDECVYRAGAHCGLCSAATTCTLRDPVAPTTAEAASELLGRLEHHQKAIATIQGYLRAWCETNGDVVKGSRYCGYRSSWPTPRVDAASLAVWVAKRNADTDDRLPALDLNKLLTLRTSKAVNEALNHYQNDGGVVEQKNASLRFVVESEKAPD